MYITTVHKGYYGLLTCFHQLMNRKHVSQIQIYQSTLQTRKMNTKVAIQASFKFTILSTFIITTIALLSDMHHTSALPPCTSIQYIPCFIAFLPASHSIPLPLHHHLLIQSISLLTLKTNTHHPSLHEFLSQHFPTLSSHILPKPMTSLSLSMQMTLPTQHSIPKYVSYNSFTICHFSQTLASQ